VADNEDLISYRRSLVKPGNAIAEILKREGIEILCAHPLNHEKGASGVSVSERENPLWLPFTKGRTLERFPLSKRGNKGDLPVIPTENP
jgi:hypothetical protein